MGMTSNHPEILDPKLIRPGRIDKTLQLSYFRDAYSILSAFFACFGPGASPKGDTWYPAYFGQERQVKSPPVDLRSSGTKGDGKGRSFSYDIWVGGRKNENSTRQANAYTEAAIIVGLQLLEPAA